MLVQQIKDFLIKISFILISLQIIHLIWLTCSITLPLFSINDFIFTDNNFIFVFLDYIEIPSIIILSLTYLLHIYKKEEMIKNSLYFFVIIIQIAHILWLTDEFIIDYMSNINNIYIIFLIIMIDYSELLVLKDLFKKMVKK